MEIPTLFEVLPSTNFYNVKYYNLIIIQILDFIIIFVLK